MLYSSRAVRALAALVVQVAHFLMHMGSYIKILCVCQSLLKQRQGALVSKGLEKFKIQIMRSNKVVQHFNLCLRVKSQTILLIPFLLHVK